MGISKGTVQITRDKDSTIVVIKGKDGGRARYRYKNQDEYLAPFLHVENLRYYVARDDEDEEDDYLLYHALQEDRKVACSFWTKNEQLIYDVFSGSDRYNVVSQETWKEG